MKLVSENDPILSQIMPQYYDFGDNAEILSSKLIKAMHDFGGIGLAANQVGLSIRAFAMHCLDGTDFVAFNPIVTPYGEKKITTEGCLSFPNVILDIERPSSCILVYNDCFGVKQQKILHDLDAVCAQHETDHLNGIVFTKYRLTV